MFKHIDLRMFLATLVLAALAVVAIRFGPEEFRGEALAIAIVAAGALKSFLKPPGPPSDKPVGPAVMMLSALSIATIAGCGLLKPSSPLDYAKATCIAANAFLDVKALRLACDGLGDLTDADIEKLAAASRAGAQKAGACKEPAAK